MGGNNNGHLDPGETVDLTSTLKNIGGVNFTDLSTTIECSDPYITIADNSGYFGSLPIDSIKENTTDPYVVAVSSSAPQGHDAEFKLIAADVGFADTFDFNLVIGTYNYLVWNPDPTPIPGQKIDSILSSLGYSGNYALSLPITALDMYQAIFVCVGIYPNNYIIGASSSEANALVGYLNNGGRMYLEGGDVWYYDPPAGYDFGPLFGINATADGTSDMGPVVGQDSTFTIGMNFAYGGENNYMDHISPTGTGFLVFHDSDNSYDCGVANDMSTYQTVGTSFELGGLVDASGVSTRAALLDSIMHFFGIIIVGIEEVGPTSIPADGRLMVYPSISKGSVNISYAIVSPEPDAAINIYDATGRLVKPFNHLTNHQSTINWDCRDKSGTRLANGVYFVYLEASDYRAVKKIILVE